MKKIISLYICLLIALCCLPFSGCTNNSVVSTSKNTTAQKVSGGTVIPESENYSKTSTNNEDVKMRNKFKINLYTKAQEYNDYHFNAEGSLPLYYSVPYYNVLDEMYIKFDYYIEKSDDDALSDFVDEYEDTVRKASDNPNYYISDYENGVCINRYVGNEKNIIIPSTLDGKDVLKLGAEINQGECDFNYELSFADREITSITLPSTVKVIALDTFESYDVKTGKGYLENIFVDSKNPYYTSVNGILYNKDKTCLLQIPSNYQNKTVVIPEGTKAVYSLNAYTTEKLVIPSSVLSFGENYDEDNQYLRDMFKDFLYYFPSETYRLGQVSNFDVSQENVYYSSQAGVLYNKDKTDLLIYPLRNHYESFVVPDSVQIVNGIVDFGQSNLKSITIGKNVKEIMACYDNIDEQNLIIKGYKNTEAEKWAKKNDLRFIPID